MKLCLFVYSCACMRILYWKSHTLYLCLSHYSKWFERRYDEIVNLSTEHQPARLQSIITKCTACSFDMVSRNIIIHQAYDSSNRKRNLKKSTRTSSSNKKEIKKTTKNPVHVTKQRTQDEIFRLKQIVYHFKSHIFTYTHFPHFF